MTRFIFPIILVGLAKGLFLVYTNPTYSDRTNSQSVSSLQITNAGYDEALNNYQKLLARRDELSKKYNDFSPDDRDRLNKLMPDNADNIRLIIDIQKIASQYGMLPRDIAFDPLSGDSQASQAAVSPGSIAAAGKDYGTFDLSFSVVGPYSSFLSFLNDLETSLRIIDITSIDFTSSDATANAYKYSFKIKTYWLKN